MSHNSSVLPLTVLLAWSGIAAAQNNRSGRMVTVPAGTPLTVRLNQALSTEGSPAGTRFTGTLAAPMRVNGATVVPAGAQVSGTVLQSKRSGRLKGRAQMGLRLDSIHANGRVYPVVTSASDFRGNRKRNRNLAIIGGSSAGGTVLGAIAGGGAGAAIGAGLGAAGGTVGAAASSNRNLTLAAETPVTFKLAQPLTLHEPARAAK